MLSRLADLLFPARENELLVRSIAKDGLIGYLEPREWTLESCEVTALLPYEIPAVRACVVEAKFHGNETAAKALGKILFEYLREELADMNAYEEHSCVLVPIPLSHERLRERGYNQIELIARHAGYEVDSKLLVRVRDTLPQTALDGQARRKNMCGAFGAARIPDPSFTYFVLDDVVTTGATIGEALRALYNADARDVRALALAH